MWLGRRSCCRARCSRGGPNRAEGPLAGRFASHAICLLGCTNNIGAVSNTLSILNYRLHLRLRLSHVLDLPSYFASFLSRHIYTLLCNHELLWRLLISFLAPPSLEKKSTTRLARTPPPHQAFQPHNPIPKTNDFQEYCPAISVRLVILLATSTLPYPKRFHRIHILPHFINDPNTSKTSWTRSASAIVETARMA